MTAIANQNQNYKLVTQIKPAQLYYYDFLSQKLKIKFTQKPKSFNYIYKATAPNIPITRKEQDLLADLSNMIDRSPNGIIAISQKELSNMTGNKKWQNCVIRKNISHILYSKYKKAVMIDGVLKRKVIIFKYTKKGKGILLDPINNSVTKIKACGRPHAPIYKYEKNINDIRSRANFSNVENSNSETSNTELEEKSKLVAKGKCDNSLANQPTTEPVETTQEAQAVEIQNPKAATVTPIQTKPSRPRNKRKTKTQAEQKQRKASTVPATNIVKNGFLGGSKRISEIQPYLTDELCETLRSKSGKLFTNKAIREITKAIAASKKGSKAVFQHVNGIVAYLTPALIKEKRDPNKIGGEGYYTVAGMTEEDKQLHKQENYLNQIENSAIHARCDYTQFRARIAGGFPINLAYALLTSMTGVKRQGSILQITMHKQVPLSQHYKQLLLKHATGVGEYAGVGELELVEIASNSNIRPEKALSCEEQTAEISQSTVVPNLVQRKELQLPKGKWGKVCNSFISDYENGEALYKHWLAPLSVVEKDGIIELSTNSDMVRDRIEQTYLPFLVKVAGKFRINKVEFSL